MNKDEIYNMIMSGDGAIVTERLVLSREILIRLEHLVAKHVTWASELECRLVGGQVFGCVGADPEELRGVRYQWAILGNRLDPKVGAAMERVAKEVYHLYDLEDALFS